MRYTTLSEFVNSLTPEYPEAAVFVENAYSLTISDEDWRQLLRDFLSGAKGRFCELVLFRAHWNILEMESMLAREEGLQTEHKELKELGFVEDPETDLKDFLEQHRRQQLKMRERIATDHKALQQLEAALRKCDIEVTLDPIAWSRRVLQGIERNSFGNTLRFSKVDQK